MAVAVRKSKEATVCVGERDAPNIRPQEHHPILRGMLHKGAAARWIRCVVTVREDLVPALDSRECVAHDLELSFVCQLGGRWW